MRCVPKIDQPCPLAASARRGIAGFCHHCEKTVHCLDGMDSAARRDLLRNANGAICVSYRVSAGLSAALALSMSAAVAAPATEGTSFELGNATPTSIVGTASPTASAPMSPTSPPTAAAPECDDPEPLERIEWMGGVSRPQDAEWLDEDSDLPDLPMRSVSDSKSG